MKLKLIPIMIILICSACSTQKNYPQSTPMTVTPDINVETDIKITTDPRDAIKLTLGIKKELDKNKFEVYGAEGLDENYKRIFDFNTLEVYDLEYGKVTLYYNLADKSMEYNGCKIDFKTNQQSEQCTSTQISFMKDSRANFIVKLVPELSEINSDERDAFYDGYYSGSSIVTNYETAIVDYIKNNLD